MLDCSRNAVSTPETVKKLIRILAKAGMNQLLLYTEDTYEVPGLSLLWHLPRPLLSGRTAPAGCLCPKFRHRLVPCIQTLAHLRNALKWPMGQDLKDNADILMVGSEKSLRLSGTTSVLFKRLFFFQKHSHWYG